MKMNMVEEKVKELIEENDFSGAIFVQMNESLIEQFSHGFANRTDQVLNQVNTRFGIASGCKLFTAIAICQLVEQEKITFETKLKDCLHFVFPAFDSSITIHHLLTHTAGIPDYFDEELMDDFEELWITHPMYLIRNLSDFLPLFQNKPMKLQVGERFHYNNAGYIILGLIVETVSGMKFSEYVTAYIFKKANMHASGYFELDALPSNTATGYIDFPDGKWKSNIYSLPVKGGADGGAFVTVEDMSKLWDSLMNFQLLSETYTKKLLTPYIHTDDDFNRFYGYGIWIDQIHYEISKYHVMGYDPGASFHAAYYPINKAISVVCSNKSTGAFPIFNAVEQMINDQKE